MEGKVVTTKGVAGQGKGRRLVAVSDLTPGFLVLEETPHLMGPKGSESICVECFNVQTTNSSCPRCGLPLCPSCQKNIQRWHQLECQVVADNNLANRHVLDEDTSRIICVLRLLLQDGWEHLQSHHEQRLETTDGELEEKIMIPFRNSLKNYGNKFTMERIRKAVGVLDTNAFDFKVGGTTSRCLYLTASYLNNNCQPNCVKEHGPNGTIIIYTSSAVKAGEELNICYTGLLLPTFLRQEMFRRTKLFTCTCRRCRDPTELGSHLTSVPCRQCGVLNPTNLDLDLNSETNLSSCCDQCGEEMNRVNHLYQGLKSISNDCTSLYPKLEFYRSQLHSDHFMVVDIKQQIVKHAGKCVPCSKSSDYRRVALEIMILLNKLQSGYTMARIDDNVLKELRTRNT